MNNLQQEAGDRNLYPFTILSKDCKHFFALGNCVICGKSEQIIEEVGL